MPKLVQNMALQDIFNERYRSVDFVGQGSFGVIASVKCIQTNESRAIKLVDSNDPSVVNEINLLSEEKYHHESIIRYYRSWLGETDNLDELWQNVLRQKFRRRFPHIMIAIELELCQGDLLNYLNDRNYSYFKGTPVTDEINKMLANCMKQVSKGLKFLHENEVVHRDMKPANILYDQNSNWKISDLGLARIVETSMTPKAGTPLYFAPEQMQRHYDSRVDVYAFGLIIFEICYPIRNFENHRDCFKALRKSVPKFPEALERLQNYSTEFETLIRGMLQRLPEDREKIDEVVTFLDTKL